MTCFLFDGIENYKDQKKTLTYFDTVYSYDKKDVEKSWKSWNESKLDIMYDPRFRPGSGPSGSSLLGDRKIVEIFNV